MFLEIYSETSQGHRFGIASNEFAAPSKARIRRLAASSLTSDKNAACETSISAALLDTITRYFSVFSMAYSLFHSTSHPVYDFFDRIALISAKPFFFHGKQCLS